MSVRMALAQLMVLFPLYCDIQYHMIEVFGQARIQVSSA